MSSTTTPPTTAPRRDGPVAHTAPSVKLRDFVERVIVPALVDRWFREHVAEAGVRPARDKDTRRHADTGSR